MINRYSNSTHQCPFSPPETIAVKNFTLDDGFLPEMIPLGDYRIDFELFKDEKKSDRLFLVQIFFTTRALTLDDFKMG